jgi:HK97 family phage major capsid protein
MKSNILALRQRKHDLNAKRAALHEKTVTESRDFTPEEKTEWEKLKASISVNEEALEREEEILEAGRHAPAPTEGIIVTTPDSPTQFRSLGEQLIAVARASMGGPRATDPRLLAVASGLNESAPSDGGFLVQKDFSETLFQRTYEAGQIASRVFRIPISANANGVKINAIDEDSRVDGSRWGGVLAYWINEADTKIASRPKFRQIQLNLQKLAGICYSTDELLQDAAALEAVIMQTFPMEFTYQVEEAIVNGTGAGQPLGFMNSGAVVTVAKDAGDTTATVSTNDVLAMWSRCWGRSRLNAVWLINQDVEPKLYPLTIGSGTAVQLLYTPPGARGNEGGQYGLLLGRPVIPTEHNATCGTPGDITLVDLSQYIIADKGSVASASSIHVRFLNDETTFRFVMRLDGQPAWKKPLTPSKGTNTYSPFVALAVRP